MLMSGSQDERVRPRRWWLGYVVTLLAEAGLTAGLIALQPIFPLGKYSMPYVLLIMAIAYIFGEGPAVLAFVLGILAFDYFFVPPLHTFLPYFNAPESLVGYATFILGTLIVGFAMLMIRRSQGRVRQLVADLQESNRRANNILESITDAFFTLNRQWRFTYVNVEAERLFHRNRDELLGRNVWEEFPSAIGLSTYEHYQKAMSEGVAVEFETLSELVHKYVDVRVYPSVDGISVYLHDISERKQAEEALSRLSAIVESSDDAVISKSLDGIILTWNSGARKTYGYSTEEAIGKPISILVPPECPDDVPAILERIRRGESVDHYEARRMTRNGRRIDISLTVSPIKNADGEIIAASTIARDVTERKQAEVELRQSEEKYRTLFETMAQGVLYFDADDRITSVNPAAEEILGVSQEDLLGKTVAETGLKVVHPDGVEACDEDHPSTMASQEGKEIKNLTLGVFNPKDNDYRWLNISAIPQFKPGESRSYQVYTTFGDITEMIKLRQVIERNYNLLQRALFPGKPMIGPGYEAAAEYVAAYEGQEVGGDFYDVFETADGKTGILIGDVSGKGIEAAALAATTRSTVRAFAYGSSRAGDALTHANATLYVQGMHFGAFVTVFLAILDMETGRISYSSAGHPPTAVCRANGEVEFLAIGHPPIGILASHRYEDRQARLGSGDKLVLYTDGISEARRGIDLFEQEGIERTLREVGSLSAGDLAARVLGAAQEWAEGRPADDAAVVVIGREPDGSE